MRSDPKALEVDWWNRSIHSVSLCNCQLAEQFKLELEITILSG